MIKMKLDQNNKDLWYGVKGALDIENAASGDVGVSLGGVNIGMAQEGLYVANVCTTFKEVGCKSVPKIVN